MRVQSDFSSPFQLFYPKDKKHSWRTDLLDNAFDTVLLTCPDTVVDHDFLAMMREYYIFMAEKIVWSKGSKGRLQENSTDLELMIDATESCNEILSKPEVAAEFMQVKLTLFT